MPDDDPQPIEDEQPDQQDQQAQPHEGESLLDREDADAVTDPSDIEREQPS